VSGHQRELERRRRELVARSASQRAAIGASISPLVNGVARADHMVSTLRRYPVVVAGIVAGVALLGARGTLSWVARVMTLYALIRRF
jgi:type VI protein secretion system component VasF